MRRYRNQVLAGLLVTALALIAVVIITGVDELVDRLRDFPRWVFAPVLALKVANWGLRYLEWRYFLGVIGVRTVWRAGDAADDRLSAKPTPPVNGEGTSPRPSAPSLPAGWEPAVGVNNPSAPASLATIRERDSVVLWLAALPLAISPGKLAEVLKALVLKTMTGTPISRSTPVVFMERLVDGLAVIILAAASLLFMAGTLDGSDLSAGYARAVLAGTTLVLLAGVVMLQIRPLAWWLLDRAHTWPVIRRIAAPLRELYAAAYDLLKLRHLALTTLLGVTAYFTDCVGFYLLLTGLGVDGSGTLFAQATFILGFSVVVAALSAMPGGAGGRELTVGALLTGVVGLSKADAGTATFLVSLFQVWVGVLVGLGVIAVFRRTLFPPVLESELAAYEARQAG
jgi:glycosyltransferase 2 family protein